MECNCTFGIIFLKSGQCMKICFPSIMYFEHPFIWEYNPEANRAECTLKLAGTNKNYNKSDLLKYLRTVEGVSIESETAIINDVNHFIKTNPLMPLYELEKPKKRPHSKSSPTFFEKKTTISISSNSAEDCKGIRIENFINKENWPTEWGNTLSCLSYFTEKNKSDARNRTVDLVFSAYDLPKNLQYKKNEALYPVKQQQMEIICALFNDILAPLYDSMAPQEELPRNLSAYLRNMVDQMMTNKRLNYGPTPTEKLSPEERDEKFSDNKHECEFAIYQEYIARVNVMLRGLLFFISSEMTAYSLTKDKETADKLELLRIKFSTCNQKDLFAENLDILRKLTIEAGKIEYAFDLLMHELNEKIEGKAACVANVYSCYQVMLKFLKVKLSKEKDSVHNALTEETVTETIRALIDTYAADTEAKKHIGIPSTAHKDIYLSKSLENALKKALDETDLGKIKKKDLPLKLKDILMQLIEEELKASVQLNKATSSNELDHEETFTPTLI